MPEKVIYKDDTTVEFKKPKLYKVILLNDNYTSMEFVVKVLIVVFHKSNADANQIMLTIHHKGKGIVGTYTYDIALTKISQVEQMAAQRGYPLAAVIEPE